MLSVPRSVATKEICISDVCDRLDGSLARVAAILNGDIQEAKSWLYKFEEVFLKNAELMEENRRLRARLNNLTQKND